ncbi:MAG: ankyrin repeat domain-containing protein [archaeon]|nr:ankyrin repeat domain-containing protein [archaeon]
MSSVDGSDLIDFLSSALENPLAQQLSDGRVLPSLSEEGEPLDAAVASSCGISIHRLVFLARAPVLARQLNLHLRTGDFSLPGMGADALAALVRFLYLQPIDKASQSPKTVMTLFRASRLYQLSGLAHFCQDFLSMQLTDALCVPYLLLSHELDAPTLLAACMAHLQRRYVHVQEQSGNFSGVSPQQLVGVFETQLATAEDLLCFAVAQRRPDVVYHLLSSGRVQELIDRPDGDGNSPLCLALLAGAQGDNLASMLVDHGADVNAHLVLHRMLCARDEQAVRFLIQRQVKLEASIDPATGDGPLHLALRLGLSAELLATLIRSGPSLELTNRAGHTPLAVCVEANNVLGTRLLLQERVHKTPGLLWRACELLHFESAQYLVEQDRSLVDHIIDLPAGSKNSLLLAAVAFKNPRATRFLLEHHARLSTLDAKGNSALHLLISSRLADETHVASVDPAAETVALVRSICQAESSKTIMQHLNGDELSPLRLALQTKALDLAAVLIETGGADVNEVDLEGINSLLHTRILAGDQEGILFLLKYGANAKVVNRAGRTPLGLAVSLSLFSCINPLVAAGADIHDRDEKGRTLLRVAMLRKDFETASALVRCGADLNYPDPDLSAASTAYPLLHLAVLEQDDSALQFLLSSPTLNVNLTTATGNATPLHLAASQGYLPGIQHLLGRGADPSLLDEGGRTALNLAILSKHPSAVSALIGTLSQQELRTLEPMFRECVKLKDAETAFVLQNAGVDIEQVDSDGQSLLHRAIEAGDEAAVIFLMNPTLRANVNSVDHHSRTPLHSAVRAGLRGIVNALLASGAHPSARDSGGRTFLWLTAQLGKDDIMKATVAAWSELEAFVLPDSEGLTPLMAAVKANHNPTVLLLLNHHANCLPPSQLDTAIFFLDSQKSQTALHYVPRYGASSLIARTLGERYPRLLKLQDHAGNTPLHIACSMGQEETAIELVKLGASLCLPNENGITALRTKPLSSTESEWQIFQRGLLEYIPREPDWLPDEVCSSCQQCSREFGFTRRRHHCRYCGQVVCADCSPTPFPIHRFNIDSPVRLCRLCYNLLSNPRSSASHGH